MQRALRLDSTFDRQDAQVRRGLTRSLKRMLRRPDVSLFQSHGRPVTLARKLMRTVDLLSTPLSRRIRMELTARLHSFARAGGIHVIDFINTHIVALRRHDPHFGEMTGGYLRCHSLFLYHLLDDAITAPRA